MTPIPNPYLLLRVPITGTNCVNVYPDEKAALFDREVPSLRNAILVPVALAAAAPELLTICASLLFWLHRETDARQNHKPLEAVELLMRAKAVDEARALMARLTDA